MVAHVGSGGYALSIRCLGLGVSNDGGLWESDDIPQADDPVHCSQSEARLCQTAVRAILGAGLIGGITISSIVVMPAFMCPGADRPLMVCVSMLLCRA